MIRKSVLFGTLVAFVANSASVLPVQAADLLMPAPGQMVALSSAFHSPVLKGIKVHTDNPFRFDFILDKGDARPSNEQLRGDSTRLIKYFLASLTTPEQDMWVNLSPYEKNRIVPESFGKTEMGRDLLAQDYLLKQVTASVIYPEGDTGKKFWAKVYALAQEKYGTTDIPIDTFNKVWIMPDKAVVYENGEAGTAYVTESRLKVMLEEDYTALSCTFGDTEPSAAASAPCPRAKLAGVDSITRKMANDVLREIVIPVLTQEVNEGRNFAQLRQVYQSLILAKWYKDKIKSSLLAQGYVDANKTGGVSIQDPKEAEKIWGQYVAAFNRGVYSFVKEEQDNMTEEVVPKKYFSGGVVLQVSIENAQESDVHVANDDLIEIRSVLQESKSSSDNASTSAAVVVPQIVQDKYNLLQNNIFGSSLSGTSHDFGGEGGFSLSKHPVSLDSFLGRKEKFNSFDIVVTPLKSNMTDIFYRARSFDDVAPPAGSIGTVGVMLVPPGKINLSNLYKTAGDFDPAFLEDLLNKLVDPQNAWADRFPETAFSVMMRPIDLGKEKEKMVAVFGADRYALLRPLLERSQQAYEWSLVIIYNQASSGFRQMEDKDQREFYNWVERTHQLIIEAAHVSGIQKIYAIPSELKPDQGIGKGKARRLMYVKPYKTGWMKITVNGERLRGMVPYSSLLPEMPLWEYVGVEGSGKDVKSRLGGTSTFVDHAMNSEWPDDWAKAEEELTIKEITVKGEILWHEPFYVENQRAVRLEVIKLLKRMQLHDNLYGNIYKADVEAANLNWKEIKDRLSAFTQVIDDDTLRVTVNLELEREKLWRIRIFERSFLKKVALISRDSGYRIFKEAIPKLHRILLTGVDGKKIYIPPNVGDNDYLIKGNVTREVMEHFVKYELAGQLEEWNQPNSKLNAMYLAINNILKGHKKDRFALVDNLEIAFRAFFETAPISFMFRAGNYSLLMNLLNAILRLNSLNPISNGELDLYYGGRGFSSAFDQAIEFENPGIFDEDSAMKLVKPVDLKKAGKIVPSEMSRHGNMSSNEPQQNPNIFESDAAMADNGGIDFKMNNVSVQGDPRNAQGIAFRFDPAMLQQVRNASGFSPVIVNIQPMKDLRGFLGLKISG